jgi:hypothetical protein
MYNKFRVKISFRQRGYFFKKNDSVILTSNPEQIANGLAIFINKTHDIFMTKISLFYELTEKE